MNLLEKDFYQSYFRLFVFIVTLTQTTSVPAFAYSNPNLPAPNSFGDPCLSYVAEDGCNTCDADGSCTELGCGCFAGDAGKECRKRALTCLKYGLGPRSAKKVPPLEGKHLGECLRALLPTRTCSVNTTTDYKWSCRELDNPITDSFDSPLCVENGKGEPVNSKESQKLFIAVQQRKRASELYKKFQTESFCMKWEDHCWYSLYHFYPPQTKFPGLSIHGPAYAASRHRIYSGQEDVACHKTAKDKPRKNECTLKINLKDFPPIDFAAQDPKLTEFSIQKEEQCVRYDNECHFLYLALDQPLNGEGKLRWSWFHSAKTSCSRQESAKMRKESMGCSSHYKAYNF